MPSSTKLPSFQFYPGDWMKDPALRSCSGVAQGLWINLLCLMFESPKRGYLQHANGKAIGNEQIARMTGFTFKEVEKPIEELETNGVFSRDQNQVIYSRRMARDETFNELRRSGGEHGHKGAEHGHKGGRPKKKIPPLDLPLPSTEETPSETPSHQHKETPSETPPSSSSSSSSSTEEEPPNPPQPGGSNSKPPPKARSPKQNPESVPIPQRLDTPSFRTTWANWLTDRKVRSKAVTELSAEQQLAALEPIGPELAIECVNDSIRNGWQGLFPEKFDTKKQTPSNANGTRSTGPHRVEAAPGKYAVPSKNSFVVPANGNPVSETKPPANDGPSAGSATGAATQADPR